MWRRVSAVQSPQLGRPRNHLHLRCTTLCRPITRHSRLRLLRLPSNKFRAAAQSWMGRASSKSGSLVVKSAPSTRPQLVLARRTRASNLATILDSWVAVAVVTAPTYRKTNVIEVNQARMGSRKSKFLRSSMSIKSWFSQALQLLLASSTMKFRTWTWSDLFRSRRLISSNLVNVSPLPSTMASILTINETHKKRVGRINTQVGMRLSNLVRTQAKSSKWTHLSQLLARDNPRTVRSLQQRASPYQLRKARGRVCRALGHPLLELVKLRVKIWISTRFNTSLLPRWTDKAKRRTRRLKSSGTRIRWEQRAPRSCPSRKSVWWSIR